MTEIQSLHKYTSRLQDLIHPTGIARRGTILELNPTKAQIHPNISLR